MMMLALDHLVIAAKDPKKSAEQFGAKHDVSTIQGGKHENWGTYNYLAYFSNQCYIEWLGIFDMNKATRSDNPLVSQLIQILKNHDHYAYQFALRTQKMNDVITHFQLSQIPFVGPINGSRKRPDKSKLEWKMLFPETDSHHLHPFLIEWGNIKNMPSDQQFINQKSIPSLILNQAELKHFQHIYQMETKDDEIQLENATLRFSAQTIKPLKFKVD